MSSLFSIHIEWRNMAKPLTPGDAPLGSACRRWALRSTASRLGTSKLAVAPVRSDLPFLGPKGGEEQ